MNITSYYFLKLLRKYISQHPGGKERVLVFVSRKDTCKWLANEIKEMFYRRSQEISCIHGDLDQRSRTAALNMFRDGRAKVRDSPLNIVDKYDNYCFCHCDYIAELFTIKIIAIF